MDYVGGGGAGGGDKQYTSTVLWELTYQQLEYRYYYHLPLPSPKY